MKYYLTTIFLLAVCIATKAQIHSVIADMETHLPLRDVQVFTNTNICVTTDYRGCFSIAADFKSATVTHPSYVKYVVRKEELPDTIFLLPKYNRLDEVVIYGKKPQISFSLMNRRQIDNLKLPKGNSGVVCNFDFGSLFDHRNRHVSQKQREKLKKELDRY